MKFTIQLVTELMGQGQVSLGLYLTVTSGYLLVAYLVGNDLTRLQVFIVTVLFAVVAGLNTLAAAAFWESAAHFGHTYGEGRASTWAWKAVAFVLGAGIFASLKFMWDVRHPKE